MSVEGIAVGGIRGSDAIVTLSLRLENPNATDLMLQSLRFGLSINDIALTSGATVRVETIPAGGSAVIELETRTNINAVLQDLATVDKQLAKHAKAAKAGGDKESQRLVAALAKVGAALNEARPARSVDLYPEERAVLKPLFLLTMKPTLYVANVSEHGFTDNPLLAAVEQYGSFSPTWG